MPRVRQPSHAGSWYEDEPAQLEAQIKEWMKVCDVQPNVQARAIIAPHAGYRYCGHVMAYAYRFIVPSAVKRVFLLGPSHHHATRRCCLSQAQTYSTPLGSLRIDQDVYTELKATGRFDDMDLSVDEAEHSLELHTPYIAHVMAGKTFTLVPIMVGALTPDSERLYGSLLAPYMEDPSNLFIISSDFCHWGSRFSYTFQDPSKGPIWQGIKWLDETGMAAIETGQPVAFTEYMRQYGNTICGRHPIGVLLQMLAHCPVKFTVKFTKYDQSSQCLRASDSSVSYAAATVTCV